MIKAKFWPASSTEMNNSLEYHPQRVCPMCPIEVVMYNK
jgi:hypothetical protein